MGKPFGSGAELECGSGCNSLQKMQELPACSGMHSRVPGPVVGVDPRSEETPRKVEEGDGQLASLEAISSLVAELLRMVQEGRRMDETPLPEGESGPLSAVLPGPGMDICPPVREWTRVCFLCGRQGHGVNRWSVDVRNGQYRDWIEVYSGKRGMVRAGGSASRTIGDRSATDPWRGKWGSGRTPTDLAGTGGACPRISLDSK